MIPEVISDLITIAIFVFFFTYVSLNRGKSPITYVLFLFTLGVLLIATSDLVALMDFKYPYIECLSGKVTAAGALIGVIGLLTSLSIFPRKNLVYRALPSIYVISGIMVVYLLLTPYFMYCDPVEGNMRGPFWGYYALWVYSLLVLSSLIPIHTLLSSKIKAERNQALYMSVGSLAVLFYLGVAQIAPLYIADFEAFSAVHVLPVMGLLFTFALLKYGMYIIVPVRERVRGDTCSIAMSRGEIISIEDIHTAYRAFRREVSSHPGLIITIRPPHILKRRYLFEKTPILWLTYFPGNYKNAVIPDRLHFEVMYAIISFVDRGGDILLIDGVDYIMENFGRGFFAEFLEDIRMINGNSTIILAVSSVASTKGLSDTVVRIESKIPDPAIIVIHDARAIRGRDVLVITTRAEEDAISELGENAEIIRVTKGFGVDRLLFEGIKKVEDSEKSDVYIDCMDYIISVGGVKNAMNFLKDVIDVKVPRGGKVYLRYTPRATEVPQIAQFIEAVE